MYLFTESTGNMEFTKLSSDTFHHIVYCFWLYFKKIDSFSANEVIFVKKLELRPANQNIFFTF